jgi:hypothetical protein
MRSIFFIILLFFANAAKADYAYPYTDPWVATVSEGLIRAPVGDSYIDRSLQITRRSNSVGAPVNFRLYQQPAGGDLIVLIPGLGSNVDEAAPNFIADYLFKAGHQVLIVPNDFTPQFAQGASATGVVGMQQDDADDMRNLITQILNAAKIDQRLQYSKIKITGYSLGALQSAYVSYEDSQLPSTDTTKLNFATTVLINSPVDLWHGITELDSLGALKDQISLVTKAGLDAMEVDILFKEWQLPTNDPNYYLTLNQFLPQPDVNFQYVIGANFLSLLQNLSSSSSSFQNYLQTVVLPTLSSKSGVAPTVEAVAEQESLTSLASFLQQSNSVFMMHNQDDFLLQDSDLQFLTTTFGSRLTLYPYGGHIGNLWYSQNQADLLKLLAN